MRATLLEGSRDSDQFAYECMRLNLGTRSDFHSSLNLDEWPDKAIVANSASVKVDGLDHFDIGAEPHINDSGG